VAQELKIEGLAELQRAMDGLRDDVARRVARAATGAAATVVAKAARQNIQALGLVDTGNLRAAVATQRARRTQLTSMHRVGVRSGKTADVKAGKAGTGLKGQDAFYWKFLELGTVKRAGTPFLQPALAVNVQPAIEAMAKRLKARIDKANKK
jgi:HK97 gp10 family phage protein